MGKLFKFGFIAGIVVELMICSAAYGYYYGYESGKKMIIFGDYSKNRADLL